MTNPSPLLLVSVRSADEVKAALAGGADWIDLKEPNAGPLAAVDVQTAKNAVEVLSERRTLSAALGELRDWPDNAVAGLLDLEGLSVVKLGLAGCAKHSDWQQQWLTVATVAAATGKQLVAVIYADWLSCGAPPPDQVLTLARSSGCGYLLIDTFRKHAGSTFDYLSQDELVDLLQSAQEASLTTVLAGGISLASLGYVPFELVDIVAVRGAVCHGDRTGQIGPQLVKSFRQSMHVQSDASDCLETK